MIYPDNADYFYFSSAEIMVAAEISLHNSPRPYLTHAVVVQAKLCLTL